VAEIVGPIGSGSLLVPMCGGVGLGSLDRGTSAGIETLVEANPEVVRCMLLLFDTSGAGAMRSVSEAPVA
jgi:hypothetical protein